jgi:hypothetical protein
MRRHGQSYVQAFNRRHRRTGTLWEGRFKSCLVDSDRYLLTVCRYIELNPVRAAIADAPESHRWSSVHANLGLRIDPLVTPHPVFLGLGVDPHVRGDAYRAWLSSRSIRTTRRRSARTLRRSGRSASRASRRRWRRRSIDRPACAGPGAGRCPEAAKALNHLRPLWPYFQRGHGLQSSASRHGGSPHADRRSRSRHAAMPPTWTGLRGDRALDAAHSAA